MDNSERAPIVDILDFCGSLCKDPEAMSCPDWIHSIVISEMNESTIAKLYDIKGHYERVQFFLSHDKIRTKMESSVKEYITNYQGKGRKNLAKSNFFIAKAKYIDLNLPGANVALVLELYNKGILFTPFPEDDTDIKHKKRLSLLLHERSNIYKFLRRFFEAYADADEAVKCHPINGVLKSELVENRTDLLSSLNTYYDVDLDQNLELDSIDGELELCNDELHGAASCLKVHYSDEKGCGIITTKEVEPDTTLIVEEAFVHLLRPSYYDSHCAHCLVPLYDRSFPCRGCVYLRFCSSGCSEKAWKTYHAQECPHIAALMPIMKGHFALRAFLMVGVDKALDIYRQSFKNKKSVNISKMQNNFEDILTLSGPEDNRTDEVKLEDIGYATFISFLARTIGLINDDNFIDFTSLTFKFLSIISCKTYNIPKNYVYHDLRDRPSQLGNLPMIGIGLYATVSLFNNSCDPNCCFTFLGTKVVVDAFKTIKTNVELTVQPTTNTNEEKNVL